MKARIKSQQQQERERVVSVVCDTAVSVLHKEFDFGKSRLDRFITAFEEEIYSAKSTNKSR